MKTPAMLTLCGSVVRVFQAPDGVDRKTGETYEGGHRVQLLAEVPLRNGESKLDLVTLSTDQPGRFQELMQKWVRVPVGVYAAKGGVGMYALKGQAPEPLAGHQ
ncbi:hypothetical protein L0E83_16540 [Marichromatium gracile]|uniref:hypothetical protein n=1 Tax=Marichromatium gracile TaxID=1048 RepID=UPI001F3B0A98|nr:hypothetical protein [Marichromatium gracile]MCF1185037.1 hypothetical protein [Marichromatium gracile]